MFLVCNFIIVDLDWWLQELLVIILNNYQLIWLVDILRLEENFNKNGNCSSTSTATFKVDNQRHMDNKVSHQPNTAKRSLGLYLIRGKKV